MQISNIYSIERLSQEEDALHDTRSYHYWTGKVFGVAPCDRLQLTPSPHGHSALFCPLCKTQRGGKKELNAMREIEQLYRIVACKWETSTVQRSFQDNHAKRISRKQFYLRRPMQCRIWEVFAYAQEGTRTV